MALTPLSRLVKESGVHYANLTSMLGYMACRLEHNGYKLSKAFGQGHASRIESYHIVMANKDEYEDIARRAVNMSKVTMNKGVTAYARFIYLIETFGDSSMLDQFITDYLDDPSADKNVEKAFNTIMDRYQTLTRYEQLSPKWVTGVLLKAYDATLKGNNVRKLAHNEAAIKDFDKQIDSWRLNNQIP